MIKPDLMRLDSFPPLKSDILTVMLYVLLLQMDFLLHKTIENRVGIGWILYKNGDFRREKSVEERITFGTTTFPSLQTISSSKFLCKNGIVSAIKFSQNHPIYLYIYRFFGVGVTFSIRNKHFIGIVWRDVFFRHQWTWSLAS